MADDATVRAAAAAANTPPTPVRVAAHRLTALHGLRRRRRSHCSQDMYDAFPKDELVQAARDAAIGSRDAAAEDMAMTIPVTWLLSRSG